MVQNPGTPSGRPGPSGRGLLYFASYLNCSPASRPYKRRKKPSGDSLVSLTPYIHYDLPITIHLIFLSCLSLSLFPCLSLVSSLLFLLVSILLLSNSLQPRSCRSCYLVPKQAVFVLQSQTPCHLLDSLYLALVFCISSWIDLQVCGSSTAKENAIGAHPSLLVIHRPSDLQSLFTISFFSVSAIKRYAVQVFPSRVSSTGSS